MVIGFIEAEYYLRTMILDMLVKCRFKSSPGIFINIDQGRGLTDQEFIKKIII